MVPSNKYPHTQVETLTEMPSRVLFEAELKNQVENHPGNVALLVMDLDDIKFINDTDGHLEGDRTILHAWNVLDESVRHGPKRHSDVFRWAGDEFTVLLYGVDTTEKLVVIEQRLSDNLAAASIKASFAGSVHQASELQDDFFHRVDAAMLEKKQERKRLEFAELPAHKRIAGRLGSKLITFAGIKPPR